MSAFEFDFTLDKLKHVVHKNKEIDLVREQFINNYKHKKLNI